MTEQPHKPGTSRDAPAKSGSSADLPVTAAGRARTVTLILQDGSTWTDEGLADFSAYLSQQFAIRVEAEARQASLTAPLAAHADPPATRESAPLDVERLARLTRFAEIVAESEKESAGTRAAAKYALTGSLVGAINEMRAAATTDEEQT